MMQNTPLYSSELKVLGDFRVGKTTLLYSKQFGSFPTNSISQPQAYHTTIENNGKKYSLKVEDHESDWFSGRGGPKLNQRNWIFGGVKDCYILLFSLVDVDSISYLREEVIPSLKSMNIITDIPFILVGTKLDLREDPSTAQTLAEKGLSPITYERGLAIAKEFGAARYIECSSLTREGVDDVFQAAIELSPIRRTKVETTRPGKETLLQKIKSIFVK